MKLSKMQGTIEQRVCLFGPPKTGKTQLVAQLAEHYNILYIGMENGHSVMSKLPAEWQDRVEVINIRDSRVYPIAIETVMKIAKGDEVFICHAHSKVKCPVCTPKKDPSIVDRVCLNELGLDWIVAYDSLTQLTNSGIAHITKTQPDDYKLQLDDWGALKVLMDKFLSQIQVAKYNCVCISHEEEVKFEDGRTKIVPVAGSSNSSRNTAKYFDHVVYCNVANKKHVVGSATDYSTSVLTGSRSDVKLEANKEGGSLLDIFTNWKLPNFGKLISASSDTSAVATDSTNAASKVTESSSTTTTQSTGDQRTPAQIALDNLKNRTKS